MLSDKSSKSFVLALSKTTLFTPLVFSWIMTDCNLSIDSNGFVSFEQAPVDGGSEAFITPVNLFPALSFTTIFANPELIVVSIVTSSWLVNDRS